MNWKEWAKDIKIDIPFLFLSYYLDDMIVLPALIALTIKFMPQNIIERNRRLSKGLWEYGKPKKWYYAIPIIVIWLFIIMLVIKAVWL